MDTHSPAAERDTRSPANTAADHPHDTTAGSDPVDSQIFVLFGATGDLATRELYPSLHTLAAAGHLPKNFRLIGTGRHEPADGDFEALIRDSIDTFAENADEAALATLLQRASFVKSDDENGDELAAEIRDARQEFGEDARILIYLSIPPAVMEGIIGMLEAIGVAQHARLIIEKPFGSDLESSRQLDTTLKDLVDEQHIFRIDHFLGKEPVQNILALRFANGLFEPAWDRNSIASVQIDVPEKLGLEGRGSFYEGIGCLRDMVVTHISQVLGFIAMDPPRDFSADALRDAKAAVFAAMRPLDPADVVYGQYEGYQDEEGVDADSSVETFVAARAYIDNERWQGVPFALRSGKALADDRWAVTITFRQPEGDHFGDDPGSPAQLVLELGTTAQIELQLQLKRPGPDLGLIPSSTILTPSDADSPDALQAYERMLLDAMNGDQTLFTRSDEIDRLWQIVTPLLENPPAPQRYPQGCWGPETGNTIIGPEGWKVQQHD